MSTTKVPPSPIPRLQPDQKGAGKASDARRELMDEYEGISGRRWNKAEQDIRAELKKDPDYATKIYDNLKLKKQDANDLKIDISGDGEIKGENEIKEFIKQIRNLLGGKKAIIHTKEDSLFDAFHDKSTSEQKNPELPLSTIIAQHEESKVLLPTKAQRKAIAQAKMERANKDKANASIKAKLPKAVASAINNATEASEIKFEDAGASNWQSATIIDKKNRKFVIYKHPETETYHRIGYKGTEYSYHGDNKIPIQNLFDAAVTKQKGLEPKKEEDKGPIGPKITIKTDYSVQNNIGFTLKIGNKTKRFTGIYNQEIKKLDNFLKGLLKNEKVEALDNVKWDGEDYTVQ
ncbi:hypothetical protein ACFL57_01870 [Candidatus Margulisiibacteriota bacterium]